MTTDKKQCLIILGMHKSGTSLLNGCLHIMGAVSGSGPVSAEGHSHTYTRFKNQNLMLIHDLLFRDLGCR